MTDERFDPTRRDVLQRCCALAVLISALARSQAWAGSRPAHLDRWARDLVTLNDDLRQNKIGVAVWQARVEQLNRSVGVSELAGYLDIDRLAREFTYPSKLAEFADPILPADVLGSKPKHWFMRVFGMRRGGAIIPHVHNHMVSAHLVVSGAFHARTHDRIADIDNAVMLRPSINRPLALGDIISMSDQRDNQHWLIAEKDRSMTFDVGVVDVPASWKYGLAANKNYMIFVDAGRKPESSGLVRAPVMTFEQCAAKYAA